MDVFLYHRVIKYLKKGQLTVQEQEICKKVGVKDLFWFDDVISQFADISKIECVKHQMKALVQSYPKMQLLSSTDFYYKRY